MTSDDEDVRDWSENDLDTLNGTCERCGELRKVQLVTDKFTDEGISDFEPNGTLHAWCKPCWQLRCDDV